MQEREKITHTSLLHVSILLGSRRQLGRPSDTYGSFDFISLQHPDLPCILQQLKYPPRPFTKQFLIMIQCIPDHILHRLIPSFQ